MPLVAYATVTSVTDTNPVVRQVPWDVLADQLIAPVTATRKDQVGLWNASAYAPGARRSSAEIVSIHALILDFDNTEERVDEAGQRVKQPLCPPIGTADIETCLSGREYVLATSYSHTDDWPHFRVVLPLAVAVSPTGWAARADALLRVLRLDGFRSAIDRVFTNPNAIYYLPSIQPGRRGMFRRNRGIFLSPDVPNVDLDAARARTNNSGDGRFSSAQVEKYYRDRIPEFEMHVSGDHYRGMCPFHGGEGQRNFGIHIGTGLWKCYSQCKTPDGRQLGGDVYAFEMRRFGLEFRDALDRVNVFLGVDDDRSVYKPYDALAEDIKVASVDSIPEVKRAIAAHGNLRQRQALAEQLITTHQLDPAGTQREIRELRIAIKESRTSNNNNNNNIVRFPRQNNELARIESDRQIEQEAQDRVANTPFGLFLPVNKYYADFTGVYPVKWVQGKDYGAYESQLNNPILPRPLWPATMGEDVITGETYMQLCWFKSDKHLRTEWLPGSISNNREALLMLSDAPVSIPRIGEISEYLGVAKTGVTAPRRDLATGMGWVRGGTRFITDQDPNITYIGRPISRRGTAAGWAAPLREIIDAGQAGYTALVVAGLAAAAPLVRLANKRNPIIGLISDSSQGKGTVLSWALAIWNESSALVLPAGSTSKGLQDLSIGNSDMPIFADEMQQLKKQDPRRMEEVLYYLGNGQRRVTSSRAQIAKGGERRFGPSFFASEVPILEGAQKGVHYRVVELHGPPLWDVKIVNKIQTATYENPGQVGLLIAKYVNDNVAALTHLVGSLAAAARYGVSELQGDDAYTAAYVRIGLDILSMVLNVAIDSRLIVREFIELITKQRRQTSDAYVVAWEYLIDGVISHTWPGAFQTDVLDEAGSLVAFRFGQAIDAAVSPLEVNPATEKITTMLRSVNATESFARVWADRGWIVPNGDHLKWIRQARNKEGKGIRVWRVSPAGLRAVGRNMSLEAL